MTERFRTFLLFASLYAYAYVFFKDPFELYLAYVIFLLFTPGFFAKYGIPRWPVLLFVPLFISGFVYYQIGDNTAQQFYKVFIGYFASVLFYHYFVQNYDYDIKKIYAIYMKSAYIVCLIGLFQIVSYMVGFKQGYNFTWVFNKWNPTTGGIGFRLSSVLGEPAYFAAVMAPAFFTSLYNIVRRDNKFLSFKKSLFILLIYPLSYSSLGIIAIFLSLILLIINIGTFKYYMVLTPVLIVVTRYSYNNVPEFRDRWDGTIDIYSTDNIYSYDIHGSSFVLYNNSHIAWTNFGKNPLFGTGLGSHPTAFDRYSLTNLEGAVQIDFNNMDANSMFLRLLSETGLYGISIMLFILLRNFIFKANSVNDENWLMSNSLALIILIYLIRQGHYFINGFPLFVWMYYYLAVSNRAEKKKSSEQRLIEAFRPVATN